MRAYEYITSKQTQWALNRGIHLIGSEGIRGRPAYTTDLDQNLFEPLLDSVRERFIGGNGNEIVGTSDSPAKMQAVHSSSALGVNVFQYWQRINQVSVIAAACGFCQPGEVLSEKLVFEDKYPVEGIHRIPPHIDVVFHNSNSSTVKRYAVECKFSEAYGSHGHKGVNPAYLSLDKVWEDIPALHKLAKSISPDNNVNIHLDSAQLIKHILGLKSHGGISSFKLLYLWYDVLGKEGAIHREEIESFSDIAKMDGVSFSALTYQELILTLAVECRQDHHAYIKYLTERYL